MLFFGLWLMITPVAYAEPRGGAFATLVQLNPATPMITTVRNLMIGAPLEHLVGFAIVTVISLIGVFLAWVVYRLALPYIIERMGT